MLNMDRVFNVSDERTAKAAYRLIDTLSKEGDPAVQAAATVILFYAFCSEAKVDPKRMYQLAESITNKTESAHLRAVSSYLKGEIFN